MAITSEFYFPSSDGKTLIHVNQWTPNDRPILGVVQIAHGVAEYGGRYAPFARYLCAHGYVVVANDHLGHGLSVIDGAPMVYLGEQNGWLTKPGESLTLALDEAHKIRQVRLTFESNFAYPIRTTMSPNRQAQQRPGVPMELVKDLRVELYRAGELVQVCQVRDNHQRLCRVDMEPVAADTVKLTPLATNGAGTVLVHEVRIYE